MSAVVAVRPREQSSANPRRLALDVLDRVLGEQRPFDDTFARHPRLADLAARDRAFARLLVTTVLRRRGQIDDLLRRFLRKTPSSITVHNQLRLGVAQLCWLGTPAHAAVGETVDLAKGRRATTAGLVNAVLRRVATDGAAHLAAQDAARLSLPAWLWTSWCAAYGEAQTRAMAAIQLQEPPLDLTVRSDPAAWAAKLDAEPLIGHSLRRVVGGPLESLPGYAEGAFWVQDIAASLPARLLGQLRGRRVLDLCAAPGGKTLQLAAAGAEVTAVEISAKRALRLRANLERTGLNAAIVIADALDWRPPEPADAILLDAPCTATGTIRRHPDIAWHKTPADLARMAGLQRRLLSGALAMLAPGGLLVYASCSLQPEEGPRLITEMLAGGLPIERVPIHRTELAGLPIEPTDAGDLRTLPCDLGDRGGMDGFFIARLRLTV